MRWCYENNEDNTLRFVLGLEPENIFLPEKSIVCIGVNPSTATPEKPDATIRNVEKLIKINGYESFYMMNLYPQRARDINMMDEHINQSFHEQNISWFSIIMSTYFSMYGKGIDVWCAWGNLIESRDYLREVCLKGIAQIALQSNCNFYSIGPVSKAGNPHHPLYVKSDTLKQPYDLSHYFPPVL
jgi:hypothetical protein